MQRDPFGFRPLKMSNIQQFQNGPTLKSLYMGSNHIGPEDLILSYR